MRAESPKHAMPTSPRDAFSSSYTETSRVMLVIRFRIRRGCRNRNSAPSIRDAAIESRYAAWLRRVSTKTEARFV